MPPAGRDSTLGSPGVANAWSLHGEHAPAVPAVHGSGTEPVPVQTAQRGPGVAPLRPAFETASNGNTSARADSATAPQSRIDAIARAAVMLDSTASTHFGGPEFEDRAHWPLHDVGSEHRRGASLPRRLHGRVQRARSRGFREDTARRGSAARSSTRAPTRFTSTRASRGIAPTEACSEASTRSTS